MPRRAGGGARAVPGAPGSPGLCPETFAMADQNPHTVRLPVGVVASGMLRQRLDTTWVELQQACSHPEHAEHVHQLRVATRRALAAFTVFRDCIPSSSRNWFEKRLRRLRRAAGEARDLDVLAEHIGRHDMATARERLGAMLARRRHRSRLPIREQLQKCLSSDWHARVSHLVEDVRSRRRRTSFGRYARRRLRTLVGSFFEHVGHKARDNEDIHALRIAGKRIRYALELFATVLPGQSHIRCLQSLEKLQSVLGDFTDHASAADCFTRWARDPEAESTRHVLRSMGAHEEKQAAEARKAFRKWWNPSRRRALRRRFDRTLRCTSA